MDTDVSVAVPSVTSVWVTSVFPESTNDSSVGDQYTDTVRSLIFSGNSKVGKLKL